MVTKDILRDNYCEELRVNGYINLPTNNEDINSVFEEFTDFMSLCDEMDGEVFSNAITFTSDDPHSGGDYFVNQRRVGEINPYAINKTPSTEDKDLAHIGPTSLSRAESILGKTGVPVVMRKFLTTCIELHHINRAEVGPVFDALGIKDIMLADNPKDDIHVQRFLRYLTSSAIHKADLHIDRSAFTTARQETTPGLIGAPGNNAQRTPLTLAEVDDMEARANASPIQHIPKHIKLFAGAGYNRFSDKVYNRNGELPLLMHGVLNLVPDETRFAHVVFMHPHLKAAREMNFKVPTRHETGIKDIRTLLEEQRLND